MRKIILLFFLMQLSVYLIKAQNVSPVESSIAKALIQTNPEAGVPVDLLSNSRVVNSYEDAATGIRYVGLQQTYKGIPVYNQAKVLSFRNGKLLSNFGYLDPNMEKAVHVASGTPTVTAESAVQSALSDRGFRATQMAITLNRKDEGRLVEFNDMGISREKITAQLTWVPDEASKTYKLAWLVYIVPRTTSDYWMVKVNALDNSILGMDNYTAYDHWSTPGNGSSVRYPGFEYGLAASNSTNSGSKNFFDFKKTNGSSLVTTATYRVVPYPAESPLHPGGAPALHTDPWNAPAVVANAITLKWHTRSAAQDHMITRGNNVWAYHDRTGINVGDSVRSATSTTAFPNLSFDFVPDFTMAPTVTSPPNQQWNITNLFYWNNIIHDIFYGYGFTEAGRNFQDDNLGRGGLGADYVNAEAQDGSGTNGANFSTPPDGSPPRMQMFLWTTATPNRDGDVDNGIIVHEYGHGISNRSHSVGVSCLNNAEQAGEGWSDYLGLMLTQNWATSTVNSGFNTPRGIGTYVLNQPNNGPGFRPQRYCTDFAVNNATYSTLPGQAIPHGVGWVFCSALWELTWELINDPSTTGIDPNLYNWNSTGGNVVALRLVMEGLRTQQCQPGFISARNAIMRADTVLYGASHACAIWRAFARRGMGFGAAEGSTSNINDQTVSFTNNPACATTAPNVTINQAAAQPDPTSVSPINFTVVFDQAVTGFATGDVTLTGTAGAALGTVTGSGTTYNVAVSGMTSSGTVIATIAAGVCQNASAQTNNASTSTDNTVTFNFSGSCTSVNPVSNQTVCHNSPTAAVNFTSPTPGTSFSWVNNTPSIGLAASGTGNIASFTATNAATLPVTATITVTPTLTTVTPTTTTFNFTGGVQTFTVPAGVNSINITTLGAQGGAGATGGNNAPGGTGGLGSRATGTLAVTPGQVLTIFVGGQGGVPASGFNGGGTGGNANSGGGGGASDVRFPGSGTADRIIVAGGGGGGGRAGCEPNTVNGGAGGNGDGNGANGANSPNGGGGFGALGTTPGAAGIGCAGFLGSPGLVAFGSSGGDGGAGQTCCCFAFGSIPGGGGGGGGFPGGAGGGGGSAGTTGCIGSDKGGGGGGAGGTSSTSGVTAGVIAPGINSGNGLVVLNYNVTTVCTGPTIQFTISVNPAPNAVSTPTTQTKCSGTAMTPIELSGAISGTTYTWVRNNTANVTGIANSGSGSPISGTPINNTSVQQIVTYTITPTANGCAGPTITATLIVDKEPAITCPANITVNNAPNQCGANVSYPPATPTGSPTPLITYSHASGSFFPVGTTTVTATASNICGAATCPFTVTVLDTQNPTITCPAPINQNTDLGSCVATVITPNPVIADNCAVTTLTWTITGATTASSPATGINFAGTRAFNLNGATGMGISTVTYVAKDAAGNTSTCSFTITVIGSQVPVITTQPTNTTVCAGSNGTFNVAVTNAVSYQWQVSTNGGSTWNSIAGAIMPTLTLNAVALSMNANLYRVTINGPCTNIISSAASLQVNPLPIITIAAAPQPLLIPGKSTTITANVSPAGGSYAWTFNGGLLAGANSSSIGPLTVDNLGTYYAIYTNPNGCIARSNDIVVSGTVSCCIYVYPNPNRGQFHVRFYNQPFEDITVRVFDLKGVLIYVQTLKGNATPYTDIQVNLNNYIRAGGTYMVEVRGNNGVLVGSEQVIIY